MKRTLLIAGGALIVLGTVAGGRAFMSHAMSLVGSGIAGTMDTTHGSDNSTGKYDSVSEVAPFSIWPSSND